MNKVECLLKCEAMTGNAVAVIVKSMDAIMLGIKRDRMSFHL